MRSERPGCRRPVSCPLLQEPRDGAPPGGPRLQQPVPGQAGSAAVADPEHPPFLLSDHFQGTEGQAPGECQHLPDGLLQHPEHRRVGVGSRWEPAGSPYPPVLPPDAADEEDDEEDEAEIGEPHGGTQRNFGFGPRLWGLWAFGAGARAGHPYFGVDVSGGWQPLAPSITPVGGDEPEIELYHSWQLSLLGYVAFNPDSAFVAGATTGYCYNSVLGRGFALAFEGIWSFTDHLGLQFHVGVGYFPDGEDRMREKKNIPDGSTFASSPDFQLPMGVGLIVYP